MQKQSAGQAHGVRKKIAVPPEPGSLGDGGRTRMHAVWEWELWAVRGLAAYVHEPDKLVLQLQSLTGGNLLRRSEPGHIQKATKRALCIRDAYSFVNQRHQEM